MLMPKLADVHERVCPVRTTHVLIALHMLRQHFGCMSQVHNDTSCSVAHLVGCHHELSLARMLCSAATALSLPLAHT
jgi:hypothetical protein